MLTTFLWLISTYLRVQPWINIGIAEIISQLQRISDDSNVQLNHLFETLIENRSLEVQGYAAMPSMVVHA
jgi:hypothetical protein